MPYWRLFYHLVWGTAKREPLIDERVGVQLEGSFRATAHQMDVVVHAVGMMPDHVHLAVSIPPSVPIATVVGRLKGAASHLINDTNGREASFAWQAEYGVVSFGERNLPDVVAYVNDQPARHADRRIWPLLEAATEAQARPSAKADRH